MKTIELLSGKVSILTKEGPADIELTTEQLIKQTLDTQPQGGFSRDDLKNRDRIETAFKKVREERAVVEGADGGDIVKRFIDLEDADFKHLQEYVSSMRWISRSPFILEFITIFE